MYTHSYRSLEASRLELFACSTEVMCFLGCTWQPKLATSHLFPLFLSLFSKLAVNIFSWIDIAAPRSLERCPAAKQSLQLWTPVPCHLWLPPSLMLLPTVTPPGGFLRRGIDCPSPPKMHALPPTLFWTHVFCEDVGCCTHARHGTCPCVDGASEFIGSATAREARSSRAYFSMPLQSNALLQPFNKRQLRFAQHRWIMQLSQNDVLQENSSEYALNLLAVRCLSNLFGAIWHLAAVCVRRDSWFRSTLSLARQNQTSRL